MKRRISSLLLALSLIVGFFIPAGATESITGKTGVADTTPGTGGSVETTLTGTFRYTSIKVSVPTSIKFNLDPTKDVTKENPMAQVTNGEFTVSNYSAVSLYLHVRTIKCTNVTLTKSLSDITDSTKAIYFTMYSAGDALPDLTAATLSDEYYMGSVYNAYGEKYKERYLVTKNAIGAGTTDSPVERTCYIAARAGLGFESGDSFEIKVTFVVDTSKEISNMVDAE